MAPAEPSVTRAKFGRRWPPTPLRVDPYGSLEQYRRNTPVRLLLSADILRYLEETGRSTPLTRHRLDCALQVMAEREGLL